MRVRSLLALILVASFVLALFPATGAGRVESMSPYELQMLLRGINRDVDSYVQHSHDFRMANTGTEELLIHADYIELTVNGEMPVFEFDVPIYRGARWNLTFDYLPLRQGSSTITTGILVNNVRPFAEIANFGLTRMYRTAWEDPTNPAFAADIRGNHINPGTIEFFEWQTYTAMCRESLHAEPFLIFFREGTNTITFTGVTSDILIRNIRLTPPRDIPTHAQYVAARPGYSVVSADPIYIHAEHAAWTNSIFIGPGSDLSSPHTRPYSASRMLLNVYGGANWNLPHTAAAWEITVPESGFYYLSMRYRQNFNHGVMSHRKLLINGEVPFQEAMSLNFPHSEGWSVFTMQNSIFLEAGTHELSLVSVMGDTAPGVQAIRQILLDMNDLYQRIIVITGTTPDPWRDYNLHEIIPRFTEDLTAIANNLDAAIGMMSADESGRQVSSMRRTEQHIRSMLRRPNMITRGNRLDVFRSGISELGESLVAFQGQPLLLDRMQLTATNRSTLRSGATFFEEAGHRWRRFVASFSFNQRISGSGDESMPTIRVWLDAGATGREQAQVLLELIAQDFTPRYGINVQLDLVAGAVVEATLAGRGPDIALNQGSATPVNFAMRGALVDLSQFDGFDEVRAGTCPYYTFQYIPEAFIPFTYETGVYGIPERMDFSMMFYRTDIFERLELDVPNTWDELVTTTLVRLRQDNMNVGVGHVGGLAAATTASVFTNLLFQHGGHVFAEDLRTTALDSQIAFDAFMRAVSFYTDFEMPREYDIISRFRTGEMPLVIAGYSMYNVFAITVPELAGLWRMVPILGTPRTGYDEFGREFPEGFIDRSQPMTGMASVMLNAIGDRAEYGWKFLRWWASAETQSAFGLRQEAMLGPGGRYTPANLAALPMLPWGMAELEQLNIQLEFARAVPEVPGSYYVSRALNSAFVLSIVDGRNPRRELNFWNAEINREIARRSNEFNFSPDLNIYRMYRPMPGVHWIEPSRWVPPPVIPMPPPDLPPVDNGNGYDNGDGGDNGYDNGYNGDSYEGGTVND